MENSIYKYVSGAERLIFMSLPDNPTFNFVKIIDKTFIDIFSKFINIEMSRFVTKETYNQIVGGFVVFKVSPETMEKLSQNEHLLDASFVVTSMGIYAILKKFLYTNDSQLLNTLSEVTAYVDIEIKTQFEKYNIAPDDFVINREMSLFLAFSGLQTFKFDEPIATAVKKSHFALFNNKEKADNKAKGKIIPEVEGNVKLTKKVKSKESAKKTEEEKDVDVEETQTTENDFKREGELKYIIKEWLKIHFLPREVVSKAEKEADQATKEKYENKKKAIELESKRLELKAKEKEIKNNKEPQEEDSSDSDDNVGL
jgi:hypothetical protein